MYTPDDDEEQDDGDATDRPVEPFDKDSDAPNTQAKTQSKTGPIIINKNK